MATIVKTVDDTFVRPWSGTYQNYAVVGTDIYVISTNQVYKYDTINKIWTQLSNQGGRPDYHYMVYYGQALYANNALYTFTYYGEGVVIHKFDLSNNTWSYNFYNYLLPSGMNAVSCLSVIDGRFVFGARKTSIGASYVCCADPVNSNHSEVLINISAYYGYVPYNAQSVDGWYFRMENYNTKASRYGKMDVVSGTPSITDMGAGESGINLSYSMFTVGDEIFILSANFGFVYNKTTNLFASSDVRGVQNCPAIPVGNSFYLFDANQMIVYTAQVYNFTYSIKDNAGETSLVEKTGQAPITSIRFNYTPGQDTGYVWTTLEGITSGTYTPDVPEGYKLSGYAAIPNATVIQYPLNTDLSVSIDDDFTFYEVYSVYNPPGATFDIDLYQCTAENNRVDKNSFLTSVGTLSGALRDECSMIAPSLVIEYDHAPEFNYVYISAFSRYFFVTGVTSVRKNLWRIDLKCDVLMTYASGIMALSAYVARNENDYNDDLVDTQLPAQNDPTVIRQEIPNTVLSNQLTTEHNYVLTVVGAAEPPAPTP